MAHPRVRVCATLPRTQFQRAFRALGLEKRSGKKMDVDVAMFNSFDSMHAGARTPDEVARFLPAL